MRPIPLRRPRSTRAGRLAAACSTAACALAMCATAQLPANDFDRIHHFLRRVSFGPAPETFDFILATPGSIHAKLNFFLDIQGLGTTEVPENANVATWLAPLQLAPNQGDDGQIEDLRKSILMRNVVSWRQLREVVTHLLERHFSNNWIQVRNTLGNQLSTPGQGEKYAVSVERDENDFFRDNAFGTVRDLVGYNATHIPMLIYLNGNANTANSINENYARELLELHMMGTTRCSTGEENYTQEDIVNCAKILTGWRVELDSPPPPGIETFSVQPDDTKHAIYNGPLFPPFELPGGGTTTFVFQSTGTVQGDTNQLLDHLVSRPQTKEFVIRKLVAFFYSDEDALAVPSGTPPGGCGIVNDTVAAIIDQATVAWGTDGDIKAVLNVLLRDPYFLDGNTNWTRVLSPVEFASRLPRALGATGLGNPNDPAESLENPHTRMAASRELLFGFSSPDGYPIESGEQLGTQSYFARLATGRDVHDEFVDTIAFFKNFDYVGGLSSMLAPFGYPGSMQAVQVANVMMFRFFGTTYSTAERDCVATLLNTDVSDPAAIPGASPLSGVTDPLVSGRRVAAAIHLIAGFPRASMK